MAERAGEDKTASDPTSVRLHPFPLCRVCPCRRLARRGRVRIVHPVQQLGAVVPHVVDRARHRQRCSTSSSVGRIKSEAATAFPNHSDQASSSRITGTRSCSWRMVPLALVVRSQTSVAACCLAPSTTPINRQRRLASRPAWRWRTAACHPAGCATRRRRLPALDIGAELGRP